MKKIVIFALVLTACSTSKSSSSATKNTKNNGSFNNVKMEEKPKHTLVYPGSVDTTKTFPVPHEDGDFKSY